ncbi:hypothetical protein HK405_008447 [Cladochytrium tenue]|nr:hypothetical protein HK405_008447 [Cladochytrium tenue]
MSDESAPLLGAPADAVAAERQQTRGLCSKRTGLWILIGAVVLSGLAFAVTFLHPRHSRGPHEPHGPSLVREAQAEYVLDLLRELEKIAKSRSEYGGSRSTTRGHGASADFVVSFLQNHTDFRVWKQPFKVWGQVDAAKPVLVARPGSGTAAAAVTAEKVYAPEVDVGVAVGSGSGALSNAIAVHVMGCEPVDLDVFKTRRSAVAVVGVDGSPARTAVSAASADTTYVDPDPSVGPTDLPPRRLSPEPLGAASSCPSACARAAAAVRAGAKGVILYSRPTAYGYPWTLPPARRLRCADPADFAALHAVPVVSMSQAAGWDLLLRTVAPEGLRVDLVVNSTYGLVETVNVLAETPTGDPDRVLVMGSHLDTGMAHSSLFTPLLLTRIS